LPADEPQQTTPSPVPFEPPAQKVRPLVESELPSLNPSFRRVAEVIVNAPDAVIHQSVSEVAEAAEASTATVVRFAQRLGFRGFHELKLALAQDAATFQPRPGSESEEEPTSILARVTAAGAEAVRDAGALVEPDQFSAAVDAIVAARRILFVAVGTSAPLAQDGGYRFRLVGFDADFPTDVHMQHVAARMLQPGDVCVAISYSGSTREVVACVEAAREAGARTVAITSFLRSPLTEVAELSLIAGSREVSFRLEAMASRLAHMALIDTLLVACTEQDEERAQKALDLFTEVVSEHRF
jgi:RpiR family carbohydrate utilization transcriptional regulator